MNSPFAAITKLENAKKGIRETLELLVADVERQGELTPENIAWALINQAFYLDVWYEGARTPGRWIDAGVDSLQRIRDGQIRTKEDALREIGDRNLSSGTRGQR